MEVADGFLKIANENMANAIKQISIQRGHDVTRYVLNCFGGAGGQHACAVADALGMTRVLIHPFAGVLSAYGMGLADLRVIKTQAIEARLEDATMRDLAVALKALEKDGRAEMESQGVAEAQIATHPRVHLRYEGTDTSLVVPYGPRAAVLAAFEAAHRQQFGFIDPQKSHVVEAVSVEIVGEAGAAEEVARAVDGQAKPQPLDTVEIYSGGATHRAAVYDRDKLAPGARIEGPAIIVEANATTAVEPGWSAEVTAHLHLVLTRTTKLPSRIAIGTGKAGAAGADPVMLEVFNNLFMSIAEQMGVVLENTSYSVNIKERLDFSCAVFDRQGGLVANAPHIPVHLGSMGESVRTIARLRRNDMRPGDVYMLNAPYNGGTHLPDVTVITPVFGRDGPSPRRSGSGRAGGGELLFYVASRGHHAEIGGITPASLPPNSRHIDEEGVLIDNFQLVSEGRLLEKETEALFMGARYPTRNWRYNLADLKAQIAANEKGVQELRRMVEHFGLEMVEAYMRHVQDNAEESVRRVLDRLSDGSFTYEMDSGARIAVAIRVNRAKRSAAIDFTGTSDQRDDNFNAPSAIAFAAVLYVFRCLVDDDIPLNAGCLKPLEVIIPEGSMLAPRYPAAVVAGNVETSQAIVDTLFGALGVSGAAQGTMNNFTFGDETRQYYETICGGAGAGPGYDGASAVHTHMTNTRLTDPEVLEWRFPVLLDSFSIRRGSGGAGRASRRRRGRAPHPLPRGDDRDHPVRPSPRAALRHGGRRAGPGRAQRGRSAPTARSRSCRARRGSTCARATSSSSKRRAAAAMENLPNSRLWWKHERHAAPPHRSRVFSGGAGFGPGAAAGRRLAIHPHAGRGGDRDAARARHAARAARGQFPRAAVARLRHGIHRPLRAGPVLAHGDAGAAGGLSAGVQRLRAAGLFGAARRLCGRDAHGRLRARRWRKGHDGQYAHRSAERPAAGGAMARARHRRPAPHHRRHGGRCVHGGDAARRVRRGGAAPEGRRADRRAAGAHQQAAGIGGALGREEGMTIRKLAIIGTLTAAGLLAAPARADFERGYQAYERGDFAAAIMAWRPLADTGDTRAMYNLGVIYDQGKGVERDPAMAVVLWRAAAEKGYAPAQHNLAQALIGGDGVVDRYDEALAWLRKAADQGLARSSYTLGKMYADGLGVKADQSEFAAPHRGRGRGGVRPRPVQPRQDVSRRHRRREESRSGREVVPRRGGAGLCPGAGGARRALRRRRRRRQGQCRGARLDHDRRAPGPAARGDAGADDLRRACRRTRSRAPGAAPSSWRPNR